jgi:dTDP-4-amino-4,6-dideoxygalactose transaminase
MIPRHSPPLSFLQFLAAQVSSGPISFESLEATIAEQLDIPHATLLPSARFGIWAGMRLRVPAGQAVAVAVFNCGAVHEAAMRSGLETVLVDSSDASFLMDLERIPKGAAWVLSEPFGQTYDLPPGQLRPFCILDMAMTVPEKQLLRRLRFSDLGVFSFGVGKAGYAGWGGIAVTHDKLFAQELSRMVRASCDSRLSPWLPIRRALTLGATQVAHWKILYGTARRIQSLRPEIPPNTATWSNEETKGKEWRRLPVGTELKMVAHNFRNFSNDAAERRRLESAYRSNLQGLSGVVLPAPSEAVLSHFTIRIPAPERDATRQRLWRLGIDTGNIFGFPRYCDPAAFPNAFRCSQELVNLPMDRRLTVNDVRRIRGLLSRDGGKS